MRETYRYSILKDGGRIKSAGASFGFAEQQGVAFQHDPHPNTSLNAARTFRDARNNPPSAIRDRFFPIDTKVVDLKGSPALYRPVLKTDQGAGKFLPFTMGLPKNDGKLQFKVGTETGYVIPEPYFLTTIQNAGRPSEAVRLSEAVSSHFEGRNLPDTRHALQDLKVLCENMGIPFTRRAGVGRNGFMFIHPAHAEEEVVLPETVRQTAEKKVNDAFGRLVDKAEEQKQRFAFERGLPLRALDLSALPVYFQADVHLFPDGSSQVAELQIPDVGLFLSALPTIDSTPIRSVQKILSHMKEEIINGLADRLKAQPEKPNIFLVTRSEVIEEQEDVLEIKELEVVKQELAERGYNSTVLSAEAAARLDEPATLLLFNLDPNSPDFLSLAESYLRDTKRQLVMIPDPFLRMAEREITDYSSVTMTEKQQASLQSVVGEVEPLEKVDKLYSQTMATSYFLDKLGVEEDALQFYHPSLPTPIPAYKFDVRSIHIASKMIQGLKDVAVRSLPISQNRAVLFDTDGGPLYATFRFMMKGDAV